MFAIDIRQFIRDLKQVDCVLFFLCAMLLLTGCIFLYGAGAQIGGEFSHYWWRQLQWAGVGTVCMFGVMAVDYRVLGRWSWLLYLTGLFLLVLVLVFGREINGARSWLVLPGGRTLQPSELMKPAVILLLAWCMSHRGISHFRAEKLVLTSIITGLPFLLIALQPDLGTGLVYLPIACVILFINGLRVKWMVITLIVVIALAPVGHRFLRPHQQERIRTFMHPSEDVSDAGWNAHQSLIAVGSGGLWGKGYMQGTQHVLGFLPRTVASNDFIFSVIAEESGFIGSGAMVCAFIGLILCCLRVAATAADKFGAYIAIGAAAMYFIHVYVNIGMTIQAAPIIGIPLPFVSYGGSYMICTMISLGLVQNVYMRRHSD